VNSCVIYCNNIIFGTSFCKLRFVVCEFHTLCIVNEVIRNFDMINFDWIVELFLKWIELS